MVKEKYQKELPRLKRCVEETFEVNYDNYKRYHEFIRMAYKTSVSDDEAQDLETLQRPIIECNILTAPLNRLAGEYSKQQPSIYASASPDVDVDMQLILFVEGYFRHMLDVAMNKNVQYNGYRQSLGGGMNIKMVRPDYVNNMSFDMDLLLELEADPTLCGFDPMAKEVTKCDAKFYFKLYPMLEDDFRREYPDAEKFLGENNSGSGSSLKWSYYIGKKRVIMLVDFYDLKTTKKTLVKLSDNSDMLEEDYLEFIEKWNQEGFLGQAPIIKEKRETDVKYFCRYTFMEDHVIDYEETNYTIPHMVWCDGNSISIREASGSQLKQFTIPYIYPAASLQSLTNLAMQTIAADMANMTMHKFTITEEAIPNNPDYQDALRDVQQGDLLVSKAYTEPDDNGNRLPLPAIAPVDRIPLPPEIMQTYQTASQVLNNILGTFNPELGVNNAELSGVAIIEGATQSNAAAMPYVVNDVLGLNQAAQVAIDLLPKYIKTPRTIPIITREGRREFVKVNQQGGVQIGYNPGDIHIKVEAGVNFAIAKHRAIQQMIALMKVSPQFEQFMNSEGLPILLDNLEFKGVDIVKDLAYKYLEKQKQEAAQHPPQPNPDQIAAQAKVQTAQAQMLNAKANAAKAYADIKSSKIQDVIDIANVINTRDANDTARLNALSAIGESHDKMMIEAAKISAEEKRTDDKAREELARILMDYQHQQHTHKTDVINIMQEASKNERPQAGH